MKCTKLKHIKTINNHLMSNGCNNLSCCANDACIWGGKGVSLIWIFYVFRHLIYDLRHAKSMYVLDF